MAIFDAGPVGDAAAPEKLARLSAEIASAKATREALKSLRVALEHANGDRFAEACTLLKNDAFHGNSSRHSCVIVGARTAV